MALTVEKIESGTVIDHIPAGKGMAVLQALKLPEGTPTALLMNVRSKRMEKKDILKIYGKKLSDADLAAVKQLASGATVNLIENGEVVEKSELRG